MKLIMLVQNVMAAFKHFSFLFKPTKEKKNTHTVLEQYNARILILIIFQNHICYFVEHFTAVIIIIIG